MNYQEFLNYMKENISNYLKQYEAKKTNLDGENALDEEEDYTVELHPVIKNNGVKLDGLIIRRRNENISPNIYLNSYFEAYQLGKPLNCIMEEIAEQYFLVRCEHTIKVDNLLDFNAIKKDIIIRLVNFEKNEEQLKNCPHRKFLDLAITYRYMAQRDESGIASSLISFDEFHQWDITEDELYRIALFNTMREFPWHMETLASVILECLKRTMPEDAHDELREELENLADGDYETNMYVLSNSSDLNGASCILYDNVIKNFAKVVDSNIIILPSSIHEVILVPEGEDTNPIFLQELVKDANKTAVGLIDLLSDNIYYYSLEKDEISIFQPNLEKEKN